ncbi:MAG TPA: hypothetical protein VG961_14005, partial [Ignavibacteria bacterium]|nr:hypothetical protein [Ignavibacteria bacterium]
IGEAYKFLSEVEDEEMNLLKAKDAIDEALTLREIEKHPMTYSTLKFTLGSVILNLSKLYGNKQDGLSFDTGMKQLQEASDAVKGYSESHYCMIMDEIEKRKTQFNR